MEIFTGIFEPESDLGRLWKNALEAGFHEVDGFIAHDKHDYSAAVKSFHKSLLHVLPWFPSQELLEIAKEKTEVLRLHDQIEETDGTTREEKLKDSRWGEVLIHAEKEAKLLGIGLGYAKNKTDFYRLHGQGQPEFREKVYEMDKLFTEFMTGDSKLFMTTAPLYLICVSFHDQRRVIKQEEHDEFAKKMMRIFYAFYVFNLHKSLDFKTKVLGKLKTI